MVEYFRQVDFAHLEGLPPSERPIQSLLDIDTGSEITRLRYIIQRPGGQSPAGRHYHVVDQMYYVLSGVMNFEIDGNYYKAGPGAFIFIPAGIRHENWNEGPELVSHLTFENPAPDPSVEFANPVPPLER